MMKKTVFSVSIALLGGFVLLLQSGCAGGSGGYYRTYDSQYRHPLDTEFRYPYDRFYRYPFGSRYLRPYGYHPSYPYRDFRYQYVPRYRYKQYRHFGRPPGYLRDKSRPFRPRPYDRPRRR